MVPGTPRFRSSSLARPAIVAVDSFIRHRQLRLQTVAAVAALVGILSVGWVTDFRYKGFRSNDATNWPPVATAWLNACQHRPDGVIYEKAGSEVRKPIPCARLRRLCLDLVRHADWLRAVARTRHLARLDGRVAAQVVEEIVVPDHDGERLVVVDVRGRPGVQGRDSAARDHR